MNWKAIADMERLEQIAEDNELLKECICWIVEGIGQEQANGMEPRELIREAFDVAARCCAAVDAASGALLDIATILIVPPSKDNEAKFYRDTMMQCIKIARKALVMFNDR